MERATVRRASLAVVALLIGSAGMPLASAGHEYTQYVWLNWDTTELDVQVVGVDDPVVIDDIRDAIHAWRTGLDDLAPQGLGAELVIRSYVPGHDVAPPPGYEPHDLEVVFNPQGFFATHPVLTGGTCTANAPLSHEELYTGNAAYRVALHEFGHCLGMHHVFEHGEEYAPEFDPMGGGRDARSCPSNLNLQVLQRSYDGEDGPTYPDEAATETIASGDYVQSDCETEAPG